MSPEDLLSQKDAWNYRAAHWEEWGFEEPLSPSNQELAFQQQYIRPDSKTLVLGATKGLCEAALEVTSSITSVDFAPEAIEAFRIEGVQYVCQDWISFLETNNERFDTIVTDNGLLCLAYPDQWERLRDAIHAQLNPGGVFCSRFFLSTDTPPKESYNNPNLTRIMPAMGRAATTPNWTVIKPALEGLDPYPTRYVFPPSGAVKHLFRSFNLIGELIPEYEEGEHFITYAFRRK